MKIEKGKRYKCLDWDGKYFTEGKTYPSIEDGRIVNNQGDSVAIWLFDLKCFQLVEEPYTEELLRRIEALEGMIEGVIKPKPCPTAAKFKDIADHANAINDIVKNAPDDTIYVPDGILDVDMAIINDGHVLYYGLHTWLVFKYKRGSNSKKFKLVKCEREELKAGDVAFRWDSGSPDFSQLDNYCIILEGGSVQYWGIKDCLNDPMTWNHWYKVVEA